MRNLEEIRLEIDALDDQLVELLNRRAALAQEVGAVKGRDSRPFFTPEREGQIHEKLRRTNPGPLRAEQLVAIFREIISAARAAEKPLTAAYWGPAGSFTHMAARTTFGQSSSFVPCDSIEEVFRAVEHRECDYGVVPVENSLAGVVPETLDVFADTDVKICAELYLPIHHHLLSQADGLEKIKRVYAGPQPAQQCRRWLRANLPRADIVEVVPTSRAAERARQDPESAAIGNKLAMERVGIPALVEHIQDSASNRTRFIVLGYNEPAKTGRDKTSLMFGLRNRPGELVKALHAFERAGINLMMIESRPAQRGSFEYLFYVDCEGHRSSPTLEAALSELKGHVFGAVVLGSYPSHDPLQE